MFGTTYASYVTRMDTCQKNVQIGSIIKEDLVKESTRENTRKESDSQKDTIFEPQKWMAVPKKKKMSQSLASGGLGLHKHRQADQNHARDWVGVWRL